MFESPAASGLGPATLPTGFMNSGNPPRMIYAGENGVSASANKQTNWRNLGPRVGLTYDLTDGKTILRSGCSFGARLPPNRL